MRAEYLIALIALAACSSPQEKIEQATRTVRSWEATARLTSEALEQRAVPRVYGKQVLDAALAMRRTQARRPQWDAVAPEARRAFAEAVAELGRWLGEPVDSLPESP